MNELDTKQLKQQAIHRILLSEDSVAAAFLSRQYDGIFAAVGREVSQNILTQLEQVWYGYEWLIASQYLDISKLYGAKRTANPRAEGFNRRYLQGEP